MSWRDVGFLVLGLFLGSNFGLLIYSLLIAARRGDELAQCSRMNAEDSDFEFFDGKWWLKVPNRKLTTKKRVDKNGIVTYSVSLSDEPLWNPNMDRNSKKKKSKPTSQPPVIPVDKN